MLEFKAASSTVAPSSMSTDGVSGPEIKQGAHLNSDNLRIANDKLLQENEALMEKMSMVKQFAELANERRRLVRQNALLTTSAPVTFPAAWGMWPYAAAKIGGSVENDQGYWGYGSSNFNERGISQRRRWAEKSRTRKSATMTQNTSTTSSRSSGLKAAWASAASEGDSLPDADDSTNASLGGSDVCMPKSFELVDSEIEGWAIYKEKC